MRYATTAITVLILALGSSVYGQATATIFLWGNASGSETDPALPGVSTRSASISGSLSAFGAPYTTTDNMSAFTDGGVQTSTIAWNLSATSRGNGNGELPAGASGSWSGDTLITDVTAILPQITVELDFYYSGTAGPGGEFGFSSPVFNTVSNQPGSNHFAVQYAVNEAADGTYRLPLPAMNFFLEDQAPYNGVTTAVANASVYASTPGLTGATFQLTSTGSISGTPSGTSQSNPVQPSTKTAGKSDFSNVLSGSWTDPASVNALEYATTDGSLFTSIERFPTGFSGPFTLSANGTILGSFMAGDSYTFAYPGVNDFTISGILTDPTSSPNFPIQLSFNAITASFDVTAVPEPSSMALAAMTILCCVWIVGTHKVKRVAKNH